MKPIQSDIFMPPSTNEDHSELIQNTISLWEGRFERQVSQEEAREMIANVIDYFSLLAEWDSAGSD